jgi:hypothetical protein
LNTKKLKGEITVFLSLIMLLLMSLIFTVIESARTAARRAYIMSVTDLGIHSVFGEFNKGLLEEFEIFGLNAGNQAGELNINGLANKISEYLSYNINSDDVPFQNAHLNLLNPVLVGGEVEEYVLLTDFKGEPFRKQAVEYMRGKIGISGIEKLVNKTNEKDKIEEAKDTYEMEVKGNEIELLNLQSRSEEAEEVANTETVQIETEEMEEIKDAQNIWDTLDTMKEMGILSLVLQEPQKISKASIDTSVQLSKRIKNNGTMTNMESTKTGLVEILLFNEYMLENLSSYQEPKSESILNYQVEYVIEGKSSDTVNLKGVVDKIMSIRTGSNFLYLMQDSQKVAEAQLLATILVGVLLIPPLIEATKMAILLGWAYVESILDVRMLLNGKNVPLFKNSANWKSSLINIPSLISNFEEQKEEADGMSYKDYLRILLLSTKREVATYRTMDIVEGAIRIKGDKSFRLDNCIVQIEFVSNWQLNFSMLSILGAGGNMKNQGIQVRNRQAYSY